MSNTESDLIHITAAVSDLLDFNVELGNKHSTLVRMLYTFVFKHTHIQF